MINFKIEFLLNLYYCRHYWQKERFEGFYTEFNMLLALFCYIGLNINSSEIQLTYVINIFLSH